MNTQEFMDVLDKNGTNDLVFVFQNGKRLPAGYHLTEVKNVQIEAVDCGGVADAWTETVIQLWLPEKIEDHPMTAQKALGILNKVHSMKPMDGKAPCRFEAEESEITVIFDVVQAEEKSNTLSIHLSSQKTQCKAQKRDSTACGGSAESSSEESCCTPTPKTQSGTCC